MTKNTLKNQRESKAYKYILIKWYAVPRIDCPVPDVPLVTDHSFTIYSVANIDNDPACDIRSINDAGEIIFHVDDVKETDKPLPESPGQPDSQVKP